jgi:hypothetical protein
VSEPNTLLLRETGVERLPDGTTAVNVGPIVAALAYLTEGRGEDRGTDEAGNPLPDLLSLAFDVVESIIVGGRKADYFRQVKRDVDAKREDAFRSSLALAKRARRVQPSVEATALDRAGGTLQALLGELHGLSLDEKATADLRQALDAFRAFGADRWVSATAQLLIAAHTLGIATPPAAKRSRTRSSKRRRSPAPAKKAPKAPPKKQQAKKRKKRSR